MKPHHLGIEALVCGLPGGVVALGAFMALVLLGISMLDEDVVGGAKHLTLAAGVVYAFVQYAILASRTAFEDDYKFGFAFWLAVLFGAIGAWGAFGWLGAVLGAVVVLPAAGATLHFTWLQLRRRQRDAV